MKKRICLLTVAAFVLCGWANVNATVVVTPDLAPGTPYRLAFITEGARAADVITIETYNAFVTAQAGLSTELAALNTTWSVIGSTPGVSAKANTGTDPAAGAGLPIYNLAGELVASGNADLWDGQIDNAIDVDQYGTTWFGRLVLTGSSVDGAGLVDYQLGTPNGYRVQCGYSDQTGSGWINANEWQGVGAARQYYAMSGVLTVVPEPASLLFMIVTGAATLAKRRRG